VSLDRAEPDQVPFRLLVGDGRLEVHTKGDQVLLGAGALHAVADPASPDQVGPLICSSLRPRNQVIDALGLFAAVVAWVLHHVRSGRDADSSSSILTAFHRLCVFLYRHLMSFPSLW